MRVSDGTHPVRFGLHHQHHRRQRRAHRHHRRASARRYLLGAHRASTRTPARRLIIADRRRRWSFLIYQGGEIAIVSRALMDFETGGWYHVKVRAPPTSTDCRWRRILPSTSPMPMKGRPGSDRATTLVVN